MWNRPVVSGAYDYPGVSVEWCPDPFQLTQKQTGEPETWESDSGGADRTSPTSPASAADGQGCSYSLPLPSPFLSYSSCRNHR